MNFCRSITFLFGLTLLLGAGTAVAQEYPTTPQPPPEQPPPEQPPPERSSPVPAADYDTGEFERRGFWANVGLGYGSLGLSGTEERFNGGAGGFALGGTLHPQWLLGGASYAWGRSDDNEEVIVGVVAPIVRFYPVVSEHFYLTAAVGSGVISVEFNGTSASETGLGALGGLGYDVLIGDSWALTPFAHAAMVRINEQNSNFFQIALSVTWH